MKHCKVWHLPLTNQLYENVFDNYRGKAKRWIDGIPYVYHKAYSKNFIRKEKETNLKKFLDIRKKKKIILFSPSRLVWGKNKNDPNDKGTDILLEGIKIFKEKNLDTSISLILMNYGPDLTKTKKLIEKLNLKKDVVLLNQQPRINILYMMKLSDIICCQFKHSWFSYGVIFEALAMSKIVMTYRKDNLYKKNYKTLYPIMNINKPEKINYYLSKYNKNKNKYLEMGKEGRRWYMKYCVRQTFQKYVSYLNNVKKNK